MEGAGCKDIYEEMRDCFYSHIERNSFSVNKKASSVIVYQEKIVVPPRFFKMKGYFRRKIKNGFLL
jgi:hypothetical protein